MPPQSCVACQRHRRKIHEPSDLFDTTPEVGPGLQDQGHQPGHVGGGHARAGQRGVHAHRIARSHQVAGSTDVGFQPVAAVDDHRAAAAERSDFVERGGGSHAQGGGVDRRRVVDGETVAPRVSGADNDDDAGRARVVDHRQQRVRRAPFGRGQFQELLITSGASAGSGFCAVQIRRGHEPLEALRVGRRRSVSLVHVAAADPAGAGRHPDPVDAPVVADHRAHRVGAVRRRRRTAPTSRRRRPRPRSGSRRASCSRALAPTPSQPRYCPISAGWLPLVSRVLAADHDPRRRGSPAPRPGRRGPA